MSYRTHTPYPWELADDEVTLITGGIHPKIIASTSTGDPDNVDSLGEREGNALLICSAVNAFIQLAELLGVPPVELASRIDSDALVNLYGSARSGVEALEELAERDRQAGRNVDYWAAPNEAQILGGRGRQARQAIRTALARFAQPETQG